MVCFRFDLFVVMFRCFTLVVAVFLFVCLFVCLFLCWVFVISFVAALW